MESWFTLAMHPWRTKYQRPAVVCADCSKTFAIPAYPRFPGRPIESAFSCIVHGKIR